MKRLQYL